MSVGKKEEVTELMSEHDKTIAKNGDAGQGDRLVERKKSYHAKK